MMTRTRKYSNIRILSWPNIRIHFFPTNPSPSNGSLPRVDGFKSPAGWLPVHQFGSACASYNSCYYVMQRRHQRRSGGLASHKKKIGPLGGAVSMVFLNVSFAMCPL